MLVQIKTLNVIHQSVYGIVFAAIRIHEHLYFDLGKGRNIHLTPGVIKEVLFYNKIDQFLLQFDTQENDIILGLAHSNLSSTETAINIDLFWDDMKLFSKS